jgi:putative holliday junction resolvase
MNYLGIDYGEKRLGLAKAESETKIATPFKTILNSPSVLNDLAHIVKTEVIEKIIVGVPISLDGQKNDFANKVIEFAEDLEARASVPVMTINEVFSSKMAGEMSNKIDESAAAIILQSFLDKVR